ncbi:alpha-tectorin-like isoform X10 [Xiphophorus maculatus]|uniref:alpha-tectorin-like isoform X10 n=1 Tax=Xiphophorus maculatus TaxID=8083 RepID=UPI000C6EDA21|nr:alpha-tectorin-like isoform X10 [Xiphophorus maculatus]
MAGRILLPLLLLSATAGVATQTTTASETTQAGISTQRQAGVSTQSQAGISTQRQAGVSTQSQAGLSTQRQAGVSTQSQAGVSTQSQAGISTQRQAGVSTQSQAGISTQRQAGVSTQSQAGLSTQRQAGVTSQSQAGMTNQSQAGLSTQRQAGVSTQSQAGVTNQSQAGLSTQQQAGVSTQSQAGFSTQRQAGVSTQSQAGLSTQQQAGVSTQSQAGFSTQRQAGVSTQSQAGVTNQSQAGLSTQRQAGVTSQSQAGLSTQQQAGVSTQSQAGFSTQRQAGVSTQSQAGVTNQSQAGFSTQRQAGVSTQSQAGVTNQSQAGFSTQRQAGVSTQSQAGLSTQQQAGVTSQSQAGLSTQRQAGVSTQSQAGLSTQRQAGMTNQSQAGLSTQQQAGVSTQSQAGLSTQRQAGVSTQSQAGMTNQSQAGLSTQQQAGVSTQSQAGLSTQRQAGVSTQSQAGVTNQSQAGLSTQRQAGVSTQSQAGLSTQRQAGVSTQSQAGLSTQQQAGVSTQSQAGVSTQSQAGMSTQSQAGVSTQRQAGVTPQSQGPLYPIAGTISSQSDDGSSPAISLLRSFNYFGQSYSQIYVNHNGDLTFDAPWYSYTPQRFPMYGSKDVIAPFWTDLDNRGNGDIYYIQYTSGSILQQVTQDINRYFPALNFQANWVFIATWHEVAYFPTTGTQTTFQAVLTTNGQYSFVLMNYGSIASTSRYVQAGYDTISSSHHFTIPGSFSSDATGPNSTFSLGSNVNVPGRWAFRVDHGSLVCNFNGQPVQLGDSFWSDSTCAQKCICTRAGLQCSNNPCSFSQICRPAAFQYSCQTVQRQTCTVTGDPHYYTFDNSVFHFQGTCTYVLSEQCQNGLPYYRVEGKNGHQGSTHVSWTVLVKVFVHDENIELVKGHQSQAKVNGSFVSTPFSLRNGSIQVYQSGFSVIISTDFGLMVSYDRFLYVRISLPYTYQNSTCGLCGNFNNRPEDDFRTREGEVVSSDVDFANSWKAAGDDEPGCDPHCSGLACAGCTAAQTALYRNSAHCGILENSTGPFAACHQQLPPRSFVDSCVYDLCVSGGYQPILCQALNVYSSQCQQNGIQPQSWRRSGFCEIPCPANSHFEAQGTGCPSTCVNPNSTNNCPLPNQESCVCNSGYLLSGGVCVPHSDCGCSFEGHYYRSGETVILDADCGRRCTCRFGSMTCSSHTCGQHESCRVEDGVRGCRPNSFATCWTRGPGSYNTFDGVMYQYPGACRLTLAKVMGSSDRTHFMITVEKVPQGPQGFSNVLKFEAQGTQVAIEMSNTSTVKVDGQLTRLPFSSGSNRIRIFQSSTHSVILRTAFGVTLQTVWPHFVRVTAPGVYSGLLGGLCGNYNADQNDDFRTPNGTLVTDSQMFGDSWRDGSLADHCVESRPRNPATNLRSSEYCGVLTSPTGPFTSCWAAVNPWQQVDACVEILQGSRDPASTLCEVLRDYALMCQHNDGSLGQWRNATGCVPTCPSNSHYELCGSSCPSSCPSLSFPFTCDTQCQEGCQCNDGFVLNGNQCVPPTSCGCFHDGRYRQAGEQFWDGEACQSFCTCNGVTGVVQCSPNSCGPQESCHVVGGEFGCHPNPHGTCSASGDPHYLTFDGKAYDFQGTCRYVLATVCNDTVDLHQFSVKAKNEPWFGLPVSITAEVVVDVLGYEVRMSRGNIGTVEVNGITRNLPIVFNGSLSIFGSGSQTFVNAAFGLSVMYDGSSTVSISVPPSYRGNMCGLCGNFNGNQTDDFHTPSGALSNTADAFGAAWKVPGNHTCSDGCGSSCAQCNDDRSARAQCEVIRAADGPFSFCHEEVDPAPYFSDCVFDVCVSGNRGSDLLCRALETYVSACQSANVRIYPWRQNTTCRTECPANSHYELCGTDCGHTCASSIDAACDHVCSEGCFCDEGFSRSGTSCVPVESCGCQHDGFYFNAGESFWTDGCSQQCECQAPNVLICSPSSCTPTQECTIRDGQLGCYDAMSTCTVLGDPHYITFDGALTHFQGSCSYVITESLRHSNNETQYKVVATNKHRGNNFVSFVSSVDIFLSNHPESAHVRLGPNKRVKVNGAEVSLPTTAGTFGQVMRQGSYIVFNAADVVVQFDGSSTLLVRMGRNYQNRVSGMCGNFNGDPNDDKVLPNGTLAQNDNQFGHSWKSETSQEGCGSTDQRSGDGLSDCRFIEEYKELCRVITNTSGPFSSCHLHSNPQPFFTSCVYDLCLYTPANGMLCSAVSAYEKTCTNLGLSIPNWRSPLRCAETDPCEQLDCAEYEWCGKKNGVYGCFCDEQHHRPNNESYDSNIECSSSSGTMSVSRCQLFEAGFHSSALHLHDSSCNGTLQDGRLIFHFDNDGHLCGTALRSNGTHFMYENTIQGHVDPHGGLISRERNLHLDFSCVYPLAQALSMAVGINPVESILRKKLPVGTGSYSVRMIPYEDEGFHFPLSTNGNIELEVDQMFYMEVRTEGVDQRQFATVLDSCWATPVNQANYPVRWDLIASQCPNPEDGTVEVIQNGVSTVSRFSFRMFSFTNHTQIYLHCSVHLCLLRNNNCRAHCYPGYHTLFKRDVSYHDSSALSIGPLVLVAQPNTGGLIQRNGVNRKISTSDGTGHLASIVTLIVSLLMTRILVN